MFLLFLLCETLWLFGGEGGSSWYIQELRNSSPESSHLIFKVILWSRWVQILSSYYHQKTLTSERWVNCPGFKAGKYGEAWIWTRCVLLSCVVLHCLPKLFRSFDRALWRYLNRVFLFVCFCFSPRQFLFVSLFPSALKKKKEDRSICNFL